jgi:hypothetical protein
MTAASPPDLLRRIAEACRSSGDPELVSFGEALAAGSPLDGYDLTYLRSSFTADNARVRRVPLLRDLAERYFAVETKRGRAASMASALADFAAHRYRPGDVNPFPPASREFLMWEVCDVQRQLPEPLPSKRTIREIIEADPVTDRNGFRP